MSLEERLATNLVTSENLAEFNAKKMGLADSAPSAADVEETPSEPDEKQNQSEPAEREKEAASTEEKKQNPKLEKRFSELTKQREQARQEAAQERSAREAMEIRLKALESQRQPTQTPKTDQKPDASQFTDAFEYAEALAEWSAENALKNRDKQDENRRANDERQKVITSWSAKLEAAKSEMPDYEDMVASSDVVVSDQIRDAILDSDVGPRILYHLAENTDAAKKLAAMSPTSAMREIGKLEARFEKSEDPKSKRIEAVTRSNAPKPITPIGSSRTTTDVPMTSDGKWEGSYSAWKEARKAGRIR